jgi:hypothetical protein
MGVDTGCLFLRSASGRGTGTSRVGKHRLGPPLRGQPATEGIVYTQGTQGTWSGFRVFDGAGTSTLSIPDTSQYIYSSTSSFEVSPDGRWIAYTCTRSTAPTYRDICLIRAEGGPVYNLTNDAASENILHWSPSGTQMVYTRSGGTSLTQILNLDLSGETPVVTQGQSINTACTVGWVGNRIFCGFGYFDTTNGLLASMTRVGMPPNSTQVISAAPLPNGGVRIGLEIRIGSNPLNSFSSLYTVGWAVYNPADNTVTFQGQVPSEPIPAPPEEYADYFEWVYTRLRPFWSLDGRYMV